MPDTACSCTAHSAEKPGGPDLGLAGGRPPLGSAGFQARWCTHTRPQRPPITSPRKTGTPFTPEGPQCLRGGGEGLKPQEGGRCGWGGRVDVVFSSLSPEHGCGLGRAQPGPVTRSTCSQFSSPSATVLALHGSCPELALGEEVSPAAAMTWGTGAWGEASTGATAPDHGWKAGAQGGARAQGGCGQGPGAAGCCPDLAGVPCRLRAPCTLRPPWLVL